MSDERAWQLHEVDVAVRARSPESATAIEWFWRNGGMTERHSEFIQRARSWCEQPEVRGVFERLRPPPPVRVNGLFPSLMDWLALSSALGLTSEILRWFDERVAAGDAPIPQLSRLRCAVLERGRLRDWLVFGDPLHMVEQELESVATMRENMEGMPADMLEEQLDETDCEIALWRRVAELERSGQLGFVDGAINASERRNSIRAWLARPPGELQRALLAHWYM